MAAEQFLSRYVKAATQRSLLACFASGLGGEKGAVTKPLLMSHNYVNLQYAIFMQMMMASYCFMPVWLNKINGVFKEHPFF